MTLLKMVGKLVLVGDGGIDLMHRMRGDLARRGRNLEHLSVTLHGALIPDHLPGRGRCISVFDTSIRGVIFCFPFIDSIFFQTLKRIKVFTDREPLVSR